MSLLSVGTIAFDDVKTPHGHAERIVGGSLSYIVLAATNYPNTVQLVSVVGDDFPDAVLQDYQKRGADLEGVQIKE
ncbi:MAG: sugar kinase, partial [Saprospiraceae bacterium]